MKQVFELLSSAADGAFVVDRRQRIVLWNDAARRMLGYTQDEVLGRPCYEVVAGRDEHGCAICSKDCEVFRASTRARAELTATRDYQVPTKDGLEAWINVSTLLLPSRWRELSALAHVFRDASRTKLLESTIANLLKSAPSRGELPAVGLPTVIEELTPREAEVLRLLAGGASTKSIGLHLGVERTTVRTHVQRVISKLGVHSRLEAVTLAFRMNLV